MQKTEGDVRMSNTMKIHIGDRILTATLVENSSTEALKGILREILGRGDVTVTLELDGKE